MTRELSGEYPLAPRPGPVHWVGVWPLAFGLWPFRLRPVPNRL